MLRRFGVMRGATVLGLGGLVAIAAAPTVASADTETRALAMRPPPPFRGARARIGGNGGTSTPTPTSSCGKFPYNGGQVISNVQVVVVFWGSSVDSLVKTTMPGFFTAITASPFLDMLSEYSSTGQTGGTNQTVGRGALVTAVTITPMVATGSTVQDTKIGSELEAQINAGVLPAPTFDSHGYANTLYFNYFPTSITVDDDGQDSCTSWCGYHSSFTLSGKVVPYAIIPDMSPSSQCSSGCGGGTEVDFVESTSAHELAEAITDTNTSGTNIDTTAWYIDSTNCGEIGDVCATDSSSDQATVSGYTVQKVWSNALDGCESNNPAVTITGCTSSSSCSGSTPVCNTTTGACVQCGSSSDCSASAPVCTTTAGTCGPCTSNSQCTNASDPVCTNGTCGPASTPTPDAGSSGSPDASTGGSPDASTGGGSDGGSTGLHDAGGGSDSGSSYGGYGDDSGSTGTGGNQADGGTGSGDNGSGWSDDNSTGSSGGCSMSSSSNDVSYSGLGIACVAGALLAARSRRSKRR